MEFTLAGNFHIGWPEGIVLALMVFGLVNHMAKHGQPYSIKDYDFRLRLVASLILFGLYAWGGFFS